MMNWLKQLMGIPLEWSGVIQDTASTGTLVALLTAREKYSRFQINKKGFSKQKFTVYASSQVHSSIDKAVKIAGIGVENLRKIPVDNRFAMIPEELAKQIYQDIQKGFQPLCVVATIGSTSSTAIDPLRKIGEICQEYSVFLHADGAHAGSATILPEMRHLIDGLELADTYLFNPHKWMMVNFDCTAYFAKDKEALIRTFEILPEYLKTKNDSQVNNYRDWGIQLGRRFRALKLWFVLRSFGAEGIQEKLRFHLALAQNFTQRILQHPDFELTAPTSVNLVCFRYKPAFIQNTEELNEINAKILNRINEGGKLYLTHTKLNDIYTIRAVFGQTNITERQLEMLWEVLLQAIREGFGSSLRG
jgi:aromatic-L-amino-acid decarboxylase